MQYQGAGATAGQQGRTAAVQGHVQAVLALNLAPAPGRHQGAVQAHHVPATLSYSYSHHAPSDSTHCAPGVGDFGAGMWLPQLAQAASSPQMASVPCQATVPHQATMPCQATVPHRTMSLPAVVEEGFTDDHLQRLHALCLELETCSDGLML